jgi:hypothetical protein
MLFLRDNIWKRKGEEVELSKEKVEMYCRSNTALTKQAGSSGENVSVKLPHDWTKGCFYLLALLTPSVDMD